MGKIVVITGAGAGVGRAVATEYARHGCDVALLSRDPERLERAARELRAMGVRALPIPTDVADADAVDRAAAQVERRVSLTMVDLPAVNTPQFDWALNKMGRRAQPVPPIFQPEVAARAICFAGFHPRREIWVGWPTVKAILANRIAPALIDRYLARKGYSGQLTDEKLPADAPSNLFAPVPGPYGAHGRFDRRARAHSMEMFTSRHRDAFYATMLVGAIAGGRWLSQRLRRSN